MCRNKNGSGVSGKYCLAINSCFLSFWSWGQTWANDTIFFRSIFHRRPFHTSFWWSALFPDLLLHDTFCWIYKKPDIFSDVGFVVLAYFKVFLDLFGHPCVMWHFLYFIHWANCHAGLWVVPKPFVLRVFLLLPGGPVAFSLRYRLGVKVGLSKVCLGLARTTLC